MRGARTWRQHAVASFVTLHLIGVVVASVGPDRLTVHRRGRAGRWWNSGVAVVTDWVRTYGDVLGPRQQWGMFATIGNTTHQVEIEVILPTGTQLLFAERSDEADWNRLAFDQYRWRELFRLLGSGAEPVERRRRFVDWVGPRAAAAVPDACLVVVRDRVATLVPPEEMQAGQRLSFEQPHWKRVWTVPGRTCW